MKYLARYLKGGPISDRRLISQVGKEVTFLVRSHDKPTDGSRPPQVLVTPCGEGFVRRWSLHILQKGLNKSLFSPCFCDSSCLLADSHRVTIVVQNNSSQTQGIPS